MVVNLNRGVLESLKRIPKGRVATYGMLAKAFKTSPRAIGRIMAKNKEPGRYPCYKVVLSSGKTGNYSAGGTKRKTELLKKDGIKIVNGKIDKKYFWKFRG